jgi:hypothetical protein
MKTLKTTICFVFGILLALVGSACFNPTSSVSAPARESDIPDAAAVFNDIDPFTVSIAVNGDGSSRSITGLERDKLRAGTGVRNFAQLIVLDTASKKIMGFAEIHQSGTISVASLPLNRTYAFFLLMGHWKGQTQGGRWIPDNDDPFPTLLNVGLTQRTLDSEGPTGIEIMMYPVVVDTTFSNGTETVPPVAGKTTCLSPGNWSVKWAIQRAVGGTDGLDRLLAAQAIMEDTGYDAAPGSYTGGDLTIRKLRYITPGGPVESEATTTTKDISPYDISAYTQTTGSGGAVNFNVEYVPFNLGAVADWKIAYSGKPVDTAFDLDGDQAPAWIIRNGLNDQAPDENTDFTRFGDKANYPNANANGAIRFVVEPEAGPMGTELDQGLLVISDGVFENPGTTKPYAYIGFKTGGTYDGNAVSVNSSPDMIL